jgi:hypothetical protein
MEKFVGIKGKPSPRHYHPMFITFSQYFALCQKYSSHLWSPDFIENGELLDPSVQINSLKPVVQFSGETRPGLIYLLVEMA